VADQDPPKPARADLANVPGLLDQYRQQRSAWLAQADELVRMREEVRQAAEREAIDIVTAARRDVRRIIVEARRELLVLTAQLHAAVETTDAPGLPLPTFANLLADPEHARADSTPGDTLDVTRDVVLEARKGVRSVLDEARAEIEALSAEAPGALTAATTGAAVAPPFDWRGDAPAGEASSASAARSSEPSKTASDEMRVEGPVHELNLDAALSSLDFQTRDLPIPTLARLLGTDDGDRQAEPGEAEPAARAGFEPLSFDTLRLSELRTLLRDAPQPFEPADGDRGPVLSADVEPSPAAPLAFDTAPRGDFFDSSPARVGRTEPIEEPAEAEEQADSFGTPRITPPSGLFGDEAEARAPARSARTFVGLFAATGAVAVVGTLWWALTREGPEPLSAAAPAPVADASAEAAASPRPTLEAAATTPAAAPAAPGTVALTIQVRRPSWIRAQIDGKDETGRIYQPGETRNIFGARSVSIRAGDAGAVFVGVDGAAVQALGPDGKAVTRAFTAARPLAAPAVATDQGAGATNAAAPSVASAPIVPADAPLPGRRPDARTPPSATPTAATSPAADVAPGPGAGVSGARPDLVEAGQQWLDAYQRRDRDAMATTGTENITVSDERSVSERFPAWQSNVRRDLDQIELELVGDNAIMTARMTEHADGGRGGEHISRVSQRWQRQNGRWLLADVRIIGEARLNQIIR